MVTTAQWLETYPGGRVALSIVIDGHSVVYATDAMPNTWSVDVAPYDEWADPTGGLVAGGTISQEIQLYTPDIDADTLSFTVVDVTGALAGSLLREGKSTGNITYLTSSVVAGSTATINVKDTAGFAASGVLYCGGEVIAYTGKTATTFTGITRGLYTINTTNGGTKFSPGHLIGNNVTTSATTAPAVTDFPRTWYGRFVSLLLHFQDPLTGQYSLPTSSRKMWTGRMQSYSDNGDGTITITAKSAIELLHRHIGSDQWKGRINEGITVSTHNDSLFVGHSQAAAYSVIANVAGLTGYMSHEQVAAAINVQLRAWNVAVSTRAGDMWSLELITPPGGGPQRYAIRLRANSTAVTDGAYIRMALHKTLWHLLGWDDNGAAGQSWVSSSTGDHMLSRALERDTSAFYELIAPKPPVIYYHLDMQGNELFRVTDEVNTFVTQPSSDFRNATPACNGVVQVKGGSYDAVYAVEYVAGSPSTFRPHAQLDKTTGAFRFVGEQQSTQNGFVRLGDVAEAPEVKQVWFQNGSAGTLMLNGLLSTGGASGYNHATYDVYTTAAFGAAVPASLVDIESFEELNDVKIQLLVTDPKPFYEYLEQILAISNRYVVWKSTGSTTQPKLSIIRPSLETAWQASWQLTEANKAGAVDGPERVRVSRAAEGVINRVVVKYGAGLPGGDADSAVTLTVDSIASQSDYGRRRTITIEAPSVTNAEELVGTAIAPALAYFSRPLAVAERSYNASLFRMAPGDTASLTDSYVTDPATGTRGATVYCWVLGTSFDLATGRGTVRVVFLPEKKPNFTGLWAPSARVDETAASSGYIAGTKVLTCKAAEFAGVTAGVDTPDASRFEVGDAVHIVELDDSTPLEWDDVVAAQSGSTITLTTGLAGWDTAKRYVIEYRNISDTTNNAQRNSAFIADDSSLSTGYSTATPYEWGQAGSFGDSYVAIDYSRGMFRPNTGYDDTGEPMSIHKQSYLMDGANNALAYRSRQVLLSEYLEAEAAYQGTTARVFFVAWVPLYGHGGQDGARSLKAFIRGRQSGGGTATITLYSSSRPPSGTAFTAATFVGGSNSVSFATTSATDVWSTELTLAPSPTGFQGGRGHSGTWISASVVASSALIYGYCNQIIVCEASL